MKNLYCKKCKSFPDDIREVYNSVAETRKWNKEMDCYEIVENDMSEPDKTFCAYCDTELEEKNGEL